jgi:cbb3-type cytochrome oxidase subunit 3
MTEILSSCWLLFVAMIWVPVVVWIFWDAD